MNIRSIARKPIFDLCYMDPIMPQFLRMALSDALSFDPKTGNHGPKANMRFSSFKRLEQNIGLGIYFKYINEMKYLGNHVTSLLSFADVIQLAGAAAIEYSGGPYIEIKVGRLDEEEESNSAKETNLPAHNWTEKEILNKYYSLDLTDDEIVALFGYRTLGFVSNKDEYKGDRWSGNPYAFDNNYYKELLDENSPYVKTSSDLALLESRKFKEWVEHYATDKEMFFDKFAKVYKKLSEIGCKELLEEDTSYLNYH